MIDLEFVGLMFTKYGKHLQDVVNSIETLIDGYDREIASLEKINRSRYQMRIKELSNKKVEAFKKLSYVCPNIDKMSEQLQEIQQQITADLSK